MDLVKFNPFSLSTRKFFHWPSLWEDWEEDWPDITHVRGLDIYETDNAITVKAAVPGIPADKINVTLEGGVLRIQGKVEEKEEEKKKKKTVYCRQMVKAVDYTTTLPREVNSNKLEAEVEDGVLTITVPLAQKARPQKIKVKSKSKTSKNK